MARKQRTKDSVTAQWLTEAISQAARSANYCVSGRLPVADPGLEVQGLGPVRIPLKGTVAKQLAASCRVAPYGKGTRTLVDTKVRKTFELDPKKFTVCDAWNAGIADVTRTAAERLGLPADRLEARLYKLLLYRSGGFFLSHRDSEKHDRMLASLIVVLPGPFAGGSLVVRHGMAEERIGFDEAAAWPVASGGQAFDTDRRDRVGNRLVCRDAASPASGLRLGASLHAAGTVAGSARPSSRLFRWTNGSRPAVKRVAGVAGVALKLFTEILRRGGLPRVWSDSVCGRADAAAVGRSEVPCSCRFCGELNAFLADPDKEVGRIAAREQDRRHLLAMMDWHQCDVTHVLERSGSPFSLVLTKTTGSFRRSLKRYESDTRLLESLPPGERA